MDHLNEIRVPVIESARRRLLVHYHIKRGFGAINTTGVLKLSTSSHILTEPYLLYQVMRELDLLNDPEFDNPASASITIVPVQLSVDLVVSSEDPKWAQFRQNQEI